MESHARARDEGFLGLRKFQTLSVMSMAVAQGMFVSLALPSG